MSAAVFDERAWRTEREAARAKFRTWVKESPTSYLAAISRTDFGTRTSLVVGRNPEAGVILHDPSIAPKQLEITVRGETFDVLALDPSATFTVTEAPQREARGLKPTTIRTGPYRLRLAHQGFPAVIVFDPKSPHFAGAPTPDWWPLDPAERVFATLAPAAAPEEIVIQSTRGTPRRALKLGEFVFELGGETLRLEANRFLEPGAGENDVSLFFRDATTGNGSYDVGRYLDPVRQPDGRWLLDFNAAYNPACAWSPHYNCPIPPRKNRLAVAVKAGERSPQGHD